MQQFGILCLFTYVCMYIFLFGTFVQWTFHFVYFLDQCLLDHSIKFGTKQWKDTTMDNFFNLQKICI